MDQLTGYKKGSFSTRLLFVSSVKSNFLIFTFRSCIHHLSIYNSRLFCLNCIDFAILLPFYHLSFPSYLRFCLGLSDHLILNVQKIFNFNLFFLSLFFRMHFLPFLLQSLHRSHPFSLFPPSHHPYCHYLPSSFLHTISPYFSTFFPPSLPLNAFLSLSLTYSYLPVFCFS